MTIDALLPFYRLTLALHVISVIPWMVGMLTMPWLYVEHARCSGSGPAAARFFGGEWRCDSSDPEKTSDARCPRVKAVLKGRSIMATRIANCPTRQSNDGSIWRRESECHA